MTIDVEKSAPSTSAVLDWEHVSQVPGSSAGRDASAAGKYWADLLSGNDWLFLIAGAIALLIICAYLIARRDKAHGIAYQKLMIVPVSKTEFLAQYKPNKFKVLSARHSPSLSRYFVGVQLERQLVIFDQVSLAVNSAGHTARQKSTFAIVNVHVELPNFEIENVESVKNNTVLFNQLNPLELPAAMSMDRFIVQGHHHDQLLKVFNADFCAILVEHPYVHIECVDNQLLISRRGMRVYSAKGVCQFIQLISDVVNVMESNSALASTQISAKAA